MHIDAFFTLLHASNQIFIIFLVKELQTPTFLIRRYVNLAVGAMACTLAGFSGLSGPTPSSRG